MADVCRREGLSVNDATLRVMAESAQGDLRLILGQLQVRALSQHEGPGAFMVQLRAQHCCVLLRAPKPAAAAQPSLSMRCIVSQARRLSHALLARRRDAQLARLRTAALDFGTAKALGHGAGKDADMSPFAATDKLFLGGRAAVTSQPVTCVPAAAAGLQLGLRLACARGCRCWCTPRSA